MSMMRLAGGHESGPSNLYVSSPGQHLPWISKVGPRRAIWDWLNGGNYRGHDWLKLGLASQWYMVSFGLKVTFPFFYLFIYFLQATCHWAKVHSPRTSSFSCWGVTKRDLWFSVDSNRMKETTVAKLFSTTNALLMLFSELGLFPL